MIEQIEEAGLLLYGRDWIDGLAADLGVGRRFIARLVSGQNETPRLFAASVQALLIHRAAFCHAEAILAPPASAAKLRERAALLEEAAAALPSRSAKAA